MIDTKQDTKHVVSLIKEAVGLEPFRVQFIKKDGSTRDMIAMFKEPQTKGKGLKFDPLSKGMIPVWDIEAEGYRMLTLRRIITLEVEDTLLIDNRGAV